jgi:hypothetical protein
LLDPPPQPAHSTTVTTVINVAVGLVTTETLPDWLASLATSTGSPVSIERTRRLRWY